MAEPRPVTLITGASAGLGAEFARQCARLGDEIVLVARRRERLDALARAIGPQAHVIEADLGQPEAPARVVAQAASRGLWVQTLINNAGFGLAGRLDEIPLARQLEMIDLNVRALTELCHAVLADMRLKGDGAILNVASTAAFQAGPHMAVYYATKAYVLSLTEALHQENKGSGVSVTALCPGPTATEFFDVAGAPDGRLAKMATDPVAVVRAGLDGLAKNKAIVVPGLMNKIGSQSNRLLPRAAMRRIIARLKA
ncbi:MAG TPA: SDR family oxidoreductase [Allosphingosinicella sp.]|nr:SDR family oxidoreductase [Allosphingosinicella sp.]